MEWRLFTLATSLGISTGHFYWVFPLGISIGYFYWVFPLVILNRYYYWVFRLNALFVFPLVFLLGISIGYFTGLWTLELGNATVKDFGDRILYCKGLKSQDISL